MNSPRPRRLKTGEDELLPYQIIGTDGGLLERPREASEVFLSPAERMDVLLDLSSFEVGEEVVFEGEQLYMFHCHILEHETAMMVNLKVV